MTEWGTNLICLAALFFLLFVNMAFGSVDKPVDQRAPVRVRRRQPPQPPRQSGGKRE